MRRKLFFFFTGAAGFGAGAGATDFVTGAAGFAAAFFVSVAVVFTVTLVFFCVVINGILVY